MATKLPSVFLSHNSQDKLFARRLASDLRSAGAKVWIDEAEIQLGDSLIDKISRGIDSTDYLAVILSPSSVKSKWVKRELDVAINQEINGKKIKVLPLLYKECDLPSFLMGKLYADFRDQEKYNEAFSLVLDRLDLKADLLRALSGLWTGGWIHKGNHRVATLEMKTDTKPVSATMHISYNKKGAQTIINQKFNVFEESGSVVLEGIGYEFIEKGNSRGWHLDQFILNVDEYSANKLVGTKSDTRKRHASIKFERKKVLELNIGVGSIDSALIELSPAFSGKVDKNKLLKDIRHIAKKHAVNIVDEQ